MEKLTKILSCATSAKFGQVVNGRVNRVVAMQWSKSSSEFVFVGDGETYAGNMVMPESYSDVAVFQAAVQKAVDEGKLNVYAYDFPVAVVSDGTARAYSNPQHPERMPMEVIRRAWPRDNDASLLELVKAQVKKSVIDKKLQPVT